MSLQPLSVFEVKSNNYNNKKEKKEKKQKGKNKIYKK